MAKKKTASKKVVKKAKPYSIELAVNGEILKADGATLLDALYALPRVKPKTKGIFHVTYEGKTSKPIVLVIPMMNRMFAEGMTGEVNRSVFAKKYAILA